MKSSCIRQYQISQTSEWGARDFVMKTIAGKLDQKSTEGCWLVIIGIKLRYLCCNKLPRIIFVLMCGSDYVISWVVNEAGSLALIDEKVS